MNFETFANSIDLSPIKVKLQSSFTEHEIEQGEVLYKMFLYLIYKYQDIPIVPTELIDAYWHMHILDTMKYMDDCNQLFGFYVHHFPYLGLRGDEDKLQLKRMFNESISLFEKEFGVNPTKVPGMNGSSICSGACRYVSQKHYISNNDFHTRPQYQI